MVWPAKEQFSNAALRNKQCDLSSTKCWGLNMIEPKNLRIWPRNIGIARANMGVAPLHQPKGPNQEFWSHQRWVIWLIRQIAMALLWFTIFDKSRSGNPCWLWVRVVFHHWCLVGLHVWDCLGARLMKRGWSHNSRGADPMKDAYVLQHICVYVCN